MGKSNEELYELQYEKTTKVSEENSLESVTIRGFYGRIEGENCNQLEKINLRYKDMEEILLLL